MTTPVRKGLRQQLDAILHFDTLGVPEQQVKAAMSQAQMQILPFVYASVTCLFVGFALIEAFILREPGYFIMVGVSFVSACILLLIYWGIHSGRIQANQAELLTAVLALIILNIIQLRLFLTEDVKQIANLALLSFAMGVLFLSTRWYLTMLIFSVAGLIHAWISFPTYEDWSYFFVLMLAAIVTGLIAHVARVRTSVRRTEILRIVELRQRQELHRRNIQLRTSMAAGRRIASILDLDPLLNQIANLIWEQYRIYYVGVFLPSRTSRRMEAAAEAGRATAGGPLHLTAAITGHVGWVLANGETLHLDTVHADARFRAEEKAAETQSELLLPLKIQERVLGVLDLQSDRPARFTAEEIPAFQLLADQIAIALENAQLYAEIKAFNQQLEAKVKERTQALQAAYVRLERLDKTKTDFITIASHELLTPLTIVNFNTQMLLDDEDLSLNGTYEKWVNGIYKGAVRMQEVVDSMLDVAKIDSSSLDLYPAPLDMHFLLRQVCNRFRPMLEERNLRLDLQSMNGLPEIDADAEAMQKVFYHLIINAIKYTPDSGQIVVDGRFLTQPTDIFPTPGIQITVADSGIGIATEVQELIFEKFYQTGEVMLHSSGKSTFKGGGSGLGLAIARGIVLAHHGRIWVESAGHDEETFPGSQFHVWLPLHQPEDEPD